MDSRYSYFPAPKANIETVNSLMWFAMDGSWMCKWNTLAAALFLPTFLTGLILVLMEKRPGPRWIDISVLFWIALNGTWLVSETQNLPQLLAVTKACFALGFVSLFVAIRKSGLRMALAHFRKLRFRPYPQESQ